VTSFFHLSKAMFTESELVFLFVYFISVWLLSSIKFTKNKKYTVLVQKITHDAIIPRRATNGSVGYDLYSNDDITIGAWTRGAVPLGIKWQYDNKKYYPRIAPKSGIALYQGIHVGAGVIDQDYTGEIRVVLFNLSDTHFYIKKGMPIAQVVWERVSFPDLEEQTEKMKVYRNPSQRGDQGFGSNVGQLKLVAPSTPTPLPSPTSIPSSLPTAFLWQRNLELTAQRLKKKHVSFAKDDTCVLK
jgi:dUTP pyrophosphatase